MTTDPIERVAKAWADMSIAERRHSNRVANLAGVLAQGIEKGRKVGPFAEALLEECDRWLTEQGIPIDKLLSGEMVASEPEAVKRCLITGNPVGTDTWAEGRGCICSVCGEFREDYPEIKRRLEIARNAGKVTSDGN